MSICHHRSKSRRVRVNGQTWSAHVQNEFVMDWERLSIRISAEPNLAEIALTFVEHFRVNSQWLVQWDSGEGGEDVN
jgi:hypothetical protein